MYNDILSCAKQLYENAPSPVLVCDADLNLLWFNKAGNDMFSGSKKDEMRLSTLFPEADFSDVRLKLGFGKACEIGFVGRNRQHLLLNFTPLEEGERPCAVATLSVSSDHAGGVRELDLQPIASIYSQSYRNAMFGIFNVVSVLASSFEQKEMYDELAYLNSLSYSCYSIMRTNLNVSEHYNYLHNGNYLKKQQMSVNQLCRTLGENITKILLSSDYSFKYEIPDEPIYSAIDAEKLTVALLNIIYNSCVFSDLQNEITLTLRRRESSYVITVSDKGIGIPREILPYVFDPFYSDTHKIGTYSGNGLGLTVAKEIVEAHGGHCVITSEPYQGTTISLCLPIEEDPHAEPSLSVPPSPYYMKRLSTENIFLAEIGKHITF